MFQKASKDEEDLFGDKRTQTLLACQPARQALLRMAGNSMHLNVSGLVILFCLSQVMIDPDLLKMIHDAKKLQRNPGRVKRATSSPAE